MHVYVYIYRRVYLCVRVFWSSSCHLPWHCVLIPHSAILLSLLEFRLLCMFTYMLTQFYICSDFSFALRVLWASSCSPSFRSVFFIFPFIVNHECLRLCRYIYVYSELPHVICRLFTAMVYVPLFRPVIFRLLLCLLGRFMCVFFSNYVTAFRAPCVPSSVMSPPLDLFTSKVYAACSLPCHVTFCLFITSLLTTEIYVRV